MSHQAQSAFSTFPGARSRQPTSGTIEIDLPDEDTASAYLLIIEGSITPRNAQPGAFDPNDISVRFFDDNLTVVSGSGFGGIDTFDYQGHIRLFDTAGGGLEIRHNGALTTPAELVEPYDDPCGALCDTGQDQPPEPPEEEEGGIGLLPIGAGVAGAAALEYML